MTLVGGWRVRGASYLAAMAAFMISDACMARPVVAVIDSGIARTAELSGVLKAEFDMAAMPARAAFKPVHDHGTMVATILNRAARGGVDIISFRIDDLQGCPAGSSPPCQARPEPIALAIDRAAELGVDAINLSLALADDPAIVDAVSRATRKGIIVVMAAGNRGKDHPDNVPMARAGYPKAVLVGAVDPYGNPWPASNRAEQGQPGYTYVWRTGVAVPTISAQGLAVTATGTSFATPIETAHRVLGTPRPPTQSSGPPEAPKSGLLSQKPTRASDPG